MEYIDALSDLLWAMEQDDRVGVGFAAVCLMRLSEYEHMTRREQAIAHDLLLSLEMAEETIKEAE